ncbi:MAG: hypothetical protein QE285_17345 [Aquabacterium sp.]|nr:hypothetical protein [Aquabacterium sp.]
MKLDDSSDCSTLPVLDASWVVRDMGDDLEGYRDVAGFFVEDVGSMREQVRAAAAVSALAMVPVIHEVANSMGVIGAWRGVCMVRALERRIRAGEALDSQSVKDTVMQCMDDSVQALRAWLASGPAG